MKSSTSSSLFWLCIIFLITNEAQTSQLLVMYVCMFVWNCACELSHLLHLLILPHTSVSHKEVRVILLTERNLLHRSFIQLCNQLRCVKQTRYQTRSPSSSVTRQGRVCIYSRRCISLYSIVRACSELSSVGSRVDTSWARMKASSCFPVLWRPIAFRT